MTTAFGPKGGEQKSSEALQQQATGQEQQQGAEQQPQEGAPGETAGGTAGSKGKELVAKSRARLGHTVERLGDTLQRPAERVGHVLARPIVGASVAGGLIAAAAGLWGATEAALGAFVGVVAYRRLKRRWREQAIREQGREEARVEHPTPAVAG